MNQMSPLGLIFAGIDRDFWRILWFDAHIPQLVFIISEEGAWWRPPRQLAVGLPETAWPTRYGPAESKKPLEEKNKLSSTMAALAFGVADWAARAITRRRVGLITGNWQGPLECSWLRQRGHLLCWIRFHLGRLQGLLPYAFACLQIGNWEEPPILDAKE